MLQTKFIALINLVFFGQNILTQSSTNVPNNDKVASTHSKESLYMTQLDMSLVVLCLLLGCGIIVQNPTIWGTAALLIFIKLLPFQQQIFPYIQQYGLTLGILILTVAIMTPIATGEISDKAIVKSFTSWQSIAAIAVGLLVTWLGARGVKLLSADPNVVTGLLIGTVAGVVFFRGVAVGPLIAAGILSLVYWSK